MAKQIELTQEFQTIKADSKFWLPEVEGQEIEGLLVGLEVSELNGQNVTNYKVQVAGGGVKFLPGHMLLNDILERLPPSAHIKARYMGKSGKTNLYEVDARIPGVPQGTSE